MPFPPRAIAAMTTVSPGFVRHRNSTAGAEINGVGQDGRSGNPASPDGNDQLRLTPGVLIELGAIELAADHVGAGQVGA